MSMIGRGIFVFILSGLLSSVYASDIARYSPSLNGATGLVKTPTAFSLKQNEGTAGIWGELASNPEHNFYFVYGVRNWLEVGVISDLPQHTTPNFLFKINSQAQDRLFKGFPILAFGLYRSTSYLTASYKIMPLTLNLGSTLSRDRRPLFFGASLQITNRMLVQLDSDGTDFGIGLRGQMRPFQFSLTLDGKAGDALTDVTLNWGAGFHF